LPLAKALGENWGFLSEPPECSRFSNLVGYPIMMLKVTAPCDESTGGKLRGQA